MRVSTFPLRGGIDVFSPVSTLRPGTAWVSVNFECVPLGGYRRVAGYERMDGRPSPAAATDLIEREARRAAITAVPGSGPIRGVFSFGSITYAFRDTLDGLAKKLYKTTPMGWMEVTTPPLLPGGKLRTVRENFGGQPSTEAVYGVDGVNKAFQFDGVTYTQITTGAEPLMPSHVAEYREHLFLGYAGSVVFSAPGLPLDYTALNGAGEIAVGDTVTGLQELQGGVLGIFCKDRIRILQGTSINDFVLSKFSDTGAVEDSIQSIFSDVIYADKQIQRLSTTDTFGDFSSSSLSEPIRTFITQALKTTQFSYVSPEKNQYTLFNENGTGYVATFDDGRLVGFTFLQARHVFVVGGRFELEDGASIILVGSANGFVYQMEVGTSFDGLPIQAYLQLAPMHMGNFQLSKRYRKVTVETDTSEFTNLFVSADFDYSSQPRSVQTVLSGIGSGLVWNLSNWNEALWNGSLKTYAEVYIDGHGRNITVNLFHESAVETPFTLEIMSINYDDRKQIR